MGSTRWQVLIVEDDVDNLEVVAEALLYYRSDADIYRASSGRECLEMLDALAPSVVVLDLALPDMDGWTVLGEIRRNEATAHIPVAAITAYDSGRVADEAIRAGFSAYFSKPINVLTFGEELEKLTQA